MEKVLKEIEWFIKANLGLRNDLEVFDTHMSITRQNLVFWKEWSSSLDDF